MGNNEKIRVVKWEDWKKRRFEKREAISNYRTKAILNHLTAANSLLLTNTNSQKNNRNANATDMPLISQDTRKASFKIILFSALLISAILIISLTLVISQTNQTNENKEELRNEFAQLTNELINSGYLSLTDYNLKNRGMI